MIEKTIGLNVLRHKKKKPDVYHDLLNHFKIRQSSHKGICIIGDRVLADVIMGNNYGLLTILV